MTEFEEKQLLTEAKNGDEHSKEIIIRENTGLVKSIAKRFFNRGYDAEDIIQLGMMGLVKAIEKFDFTYEVKFSTYAVPVITGEIKSFLRDDGMIKVSRSTKELYISIKNFMCEFEEKNGRQPFVSETAENLGVSAEDVVYAISSAQTVCSLDDNKDDESYSPGERIEDSSALSEENITDKLLVNELISSLKARDRQIIVMRYFMGMTQSEISKKLSLSQVQISRLERKILTAMKEKCING